MGTRLAVTTNNRWLRSIARVPTDSGNAATTSESASHVVVVARQWRARSVSNTQCEQHGLLLDSRRMGSS
jgi:hypothetical protein